MSSDVQLRMQESEESCGKFLRELVHDLRNTLQAMQLTLRVMQNQPAVQETPKLAEYVSRLDAAKEEADLVLRGASSYRRIRFEPLVFEEIDLNYLIETIQLPDVWREGDNLLIEGTLPAVWCDKTLLQIIFESLVRNGLQYNTQPQRRVVVRADSEDADAVFTRVSVEDNGVGIEPEHQERVFEAFKRLGQQQIPGNGMGLFLAQEAAQRLGGSLALESTPGMGSRFIVEIPKRRP